MSLAEVNNRKNEGASQSEKYLRELTKTFTGIEKPLKNVKIAETLDDLIAELHNVFNSDRVNIEYVNHLLLSYTSNPKEWKKFAKFDRFKYTRNLVDAGNGKFNLMIICWGEGHGSAIHDHADCHCFMKMLKGELVESRYAWPNTEKDSNNTENNVCNAIWDKHGMDHEDYSGSQLQLRDKVTMETNSVHYINDLLGLHRVENASHTDSAVSLHLYCPPYDSCSVFNEKTGKKTRCSVEFYSINGQKKKNDEIPYRQEDH